MAAQWSLISSCSSNRPPGQFRRDPEVWAPQTHRPLQSKQDKPLRYCCHPCLIPPSFLFFSLLQMYKDIWSHTYNSDLQRALVLHHSMCVLVCSLILCMKTVDVLYWPLNAKELLEQPKSLYTSYPTTQKLVHSQPYTCTYMHTQHIKTLLRPDSLSLSEGSFSSDCLFQSAWLIHSIRCQIGSSSRPLWFPPYMSQLVICSWSNFFDDMTVTQMNPSPSSA